MIISSWLAKTMTSTGSYQSSVHTRIS